MDQAGLPEVRWPMPIAVRLLAMAIGGALIVWPAMDLWRALWPLNLFTPFLAIIVLGAVLIGSIFLLAGVAGEGQRWRYEAGVLWIERRIWNRRWGTRLTALDIASIEVRCIRDMDRADRWRVAVIPSPAFGKSPQRLVTGVLFAFESNDYHTPAEAEAAADALRQHLGMTA